MGNVVARIGGSIFHELHMEQSFSRDSARMIRIDSGGDTSADAANGLLVHYTDTILDSNTNYIFQPIDNGKYLHTSADPDFVWTLGSGAQKSPQFSVVNQMEHGGTIQSWSNDSQFLSIKFDTEHKLKSENTLLLPAETVLRCTYVEDGGLYDTYGTELQTELEWTDVHFRQNRKVKKDPHWKRGTYEELARQIREGHFKTNDTLRIINGDEIIDERISDNAFFDSEDARVQVQKMKLRYGRDYYIFTPKTKTTRVYYIPDQQNAYSRNTRCIFLLGSDFAPAKNQLVKGSNSGAKDHVVIKNVQSLQARSLSSAVPAPYSDPLMFCGDTHVFQLVQTEP